MTRRAISKATKLEAYLDIRKKISSLDTGEDAWFIGLTYLRRESSKNPNSLFLLNDYHESDNEIAYRVSDQYMSRIPKITAIVFRNWLGYVRKWGVPWF